MFGLLSTCTTAILDGSLASNSKRRIKCVFLNNRPGQARPKFVNVNFKEPLYYSFTVSINKCGWSCTTIGNYYVRINVADKVKNINIKIFNLILEVKETRFLVQHESSERICKLNENLFNSKQKWSHHECWCECKELDDWSYFKDNYTWNPSACSWGSVRRHAELTNI